MIVTVVSVQLIKFSGAPNIETYYFLCTFALAVLTFIYLDTIFSGFVGAVSLLYLSNNLDITTYNQSRLTLEALCVIGILLCGKVGPDRGVFLSAWFLRLLQSLRIRTGGLSPHWLTSRFSSVPSQSDTLERDESATRFNRDARW
ncbi:hypothetical protein [uncultured Paraglaciecola sp.]|uniref:hypothetical protein n=1 Tax=uncultured Paraglaciecola sp. TaxID=1765024 RepID=UPI0026397438|nr:hypothetical protein [uncultured Paraglaciecola sp.]